MTLETIVFEIISRVVKIPAAKLNKDSGLGLVEGWDSLKHTELILQLENEFDISFDFHELDKITSVEKILSSLRLKGIDL